MKNRLGRAIVALIFLFLFGIYFYKQLGIRTFSDDIAFWGEATSLHPEGFEASSAVAEQNGTGAAASEAQPEPTPEPTATPEPTPAPIAFDLSSWEYMLVNGDHSIDQYVPAELVYLDQAVEALDIQTAYNQNRVAVDARIAQPLLDMAKACKDAGYPVFLSSGYRSYSEQSANFQRICANNGITDGKDANGHYITMPAGCSEHQTGLCCDITDKYREIKNDEIFQTDTYKWLKEHCAEYGFILRFPTGKEDITGVMNEGWHFRYVGLEAAKYIKENDLTLEEFWQRFGPAETAAETM
ncbi:MAG: M15 family metallopeptidase [Oscillospiraceae bacterium]|nr:M15 family metallopeptidase [Oscillospiraceae bacterium]